MAFVGAGGKTTAAWRLLRLLAAAGERVVFTTTTRIFEPLENGLPLILASHPDRAEISGALAGSPTLVLAAGRGEEGDPAQAARSPYAASPVKLVGVDPEALSDLVLELPGVTWLVEADGAKGRLLKAPAEYEPVIPGGADRVVVTAGLDAIGMALDERMVHRPDIAARLLDVPPGVTITPDLLAALVGHAGGGLKGVPPGAEAIVLLTRWSDRRHDACAQAMARRLLSERGIRRVVLADLRAPNPVLETWQPVVRDADSEGI